MGVEFISILIAILALGLVLAGVNRRDASHKKIQTPLIRTAHIIQKEHFTPVPIDGLLRWLLGDSSGARNPGGRGSG